MKKQKFHLLKLLMMTVTVALLATGCELLKYLEKTKNYEGIISLTYEYGSFSGGYYELKLYYENEIPYIQAKGNNGVQLSYNHEIEQDKVIAFEEALNQQNIAAMDGFHKSDDDILDGYSFSLDIQYSADSLSASGYMKYPKNYTEIDKVITDFFFDNIEANTTFDRNHPMEDSTANDEYAFLGVPSTNSKITSFTYSYMIEGKEIVRFIYDSESTPMFDVSYSLNTMYAIKDYEWQETKIDSSIRLEDMTKLEELIKLYDLFSYSGYNDMMPSENDTENVVRTDINVLYEDETYINISYKNIMNERFSGWEDDFKKGIEDLFGITISDYITMN
jgi:hypothetical protein